MQIFIPKWLMIVSSYIVMFMAYSFLGWIVDVVSSYKTTKKIQNRGLLFGPFCPIYAFGALISLQILNSFQIKDVVIVFVAGALISATIEYVTHWFFDVFYRIELWNYDNHQYNLNQRICLRNTLWFGLGIVVAMRWFNPWLLDLIEKQPPIVILILAIIFLIYFLADLIVVMIMLGQLRPFFAIPLDIARDIKRLRGEVDQAVSYVGEDIIDVADDAIDSVVDNLTFVKKTALRHLTYGFRGFRISKRPPKVRRRSKKIRS